MLATTWLPATTRHEDLLARVSIKIRSSELPIFHRMRFPYTIHCQSKLELRWQILQRLSEASTSRSDVSLWAAFISFARVVVFGLQYSEPATNTDDAPHYPHHSSPQCHSNQQGLVHLMRGEHSQAGNSEHHKTAVATMCGDRQ